MLSIMLERSQLDVLVRSLATTLSEIASMLQSDSTPEPNILNMAIGSNSYLT